MCELLGMSANVPTDVVFSFTGLMQRGGRTGPHRDGWGIGFYEGRGLRLFQDPQASVDSELARLVQRYPDRLLIMSKIVELYFTLFLNIHLSRHHVRPIFVSECRHFEAIW